MTTLTAGQQEKIRKRLAEFGYSLEEFALIYQCFCDEIEPHPVHGWSARNCIKDVRGTLVDIAGYGLCGVSFYYDKAKQYDLNEQKLKILGITKKILVSDQITNDLINAQQSFASDGYDLFLREGYRSRLAYAYVYTHKMIKDGQKEADRIYNPLERPHASGMAIDIVLMRDGRTVKLRDGKHDPQALFYGYYKNPKNTAKIKAKDTGLATEQSVKFRLFQEYMVATMRKYNFDLASKGEYFHFNHKALGAKPYTALPIRSLEAMRKIKTMENPEFL